jgi:hypothetical protein
VNPKSSIAVRYVPPLGCGDPVEVVDGPLPLLVGPEPELVGPLPLLVGPEAEAPVVVFGLLLPPQAAANRAKVQVRAIAPSNFRFVTFPPFWEDK